MTQFTLVGAGLAGPLLACYLSRAGYRVDLYERRADPRSHDAERGRSINLALSVRGIHALRELGLADEVLRNAIPMRGRMMHSPSGQLSFQPYGKDDAESINSVSRGGLNRLLVEAALQSPNVRCFFDHRCTGYDVDANVLEIQQGPGGPTIRTQPESLIACDGAYSVVRAALQRRERFDYSQDYLSHGYKELTIPPGPGGVHQLEKHALHIWPRRSFMMIALPNLDGSFTCTLFFPHDGPLSFASLRSDDDIRRFFVEQFPDAVAHMPDLVADYRRNPVGSLVTIRCQPWHHGGRVALLGDSAHAVVPFLGQGMNAAFEDCTVLNECLKTHPQDIATAFTNYERRRKPHADALAELAVHNFLEMRDYVSSPWFLLRKRVEILLHRLLPGWYEPLYTLVTFTRTPYADAVQRVERQNRILVAIGGTLLALLLLGLFLLWRGLPWI